MEKPVDLAAIPSGMDNDPRADEDIIDQRAGEAVPPAQPANDPDALTNAIAYALDGSGVGLPGSTPVAGAPGKVITEGITGAGLTEEEAALS